ncbi:hypothetical protein, partial [Agromyces bauzanensis]
DWAGDTIDLVDAVTGEVTRAVLFVAVLGVTGERWCRLTSTTPEPAPSPRNAGTRSLDYQYQLTLRAT